MKLSFIALSVTLLSTQLKANDTIRVNENQYLIDLSQNLILTNMSVSGINSNWTDTKTHIAINEVCEFVTPVDQVHIGIGYRVYAPSQDADFTLYFTELPLVHITTDNTIMDEPDVSAKFSLIESNQNYIESDIGIQYRGNWLQSKEKKSMEFEFWTDSLGTATKDYSLLGMNEDDDWNLQALYIEPLRIRSKAANDLWRMIDTLHYQNQEPKAVNGIRMEYVELFLNNEYRGLYCIGEKVKRKQLKLKKHNGEIRGELYKGAYWAGATTFTSAPPFDNDSLNWAGFDYKHPKEETDWSSFYGLIDFTVHSSNSYFYDNYKDYFELDNLVNSD